MLGNAAAATVWANMSDIWGRKPILLSALVLFFGSSIICAAAINMPMLIAGRALQGIASGGMLQMVNIVVSDIFSVRYAALAVKEQTVQENGRRNEQIQLTGPIT